MLVCRRSSVLSLGESGFVWVVALLVVTMLFSYTPIQVHTHTTGMTHVLDIIRYFVNRNPFSR